LGWLEGGLSASLEKTVIDAEMIRQWAQSLKPFDVSDEALAVDAIKSVEPGGHFFGTGHTLERFERAFYAADDVRLAQLRNLVRGRCQDRDAAGNTRLETNA
jgi:trimethylamine:corrinoid methyltransferase-like protein